MSALVIKIAETPAGMMGHIAASHLFTFQKKNGNCKIELSLVKYDIYFVRFPTPDLCEAFSRQLTAMRVSHETLTGLPGDVEVYELRNQGSGNVLGDSLRRHS